MIFLRKKPKIVVVLGQTATGKSDLAVDIAEKFNGEVVSADSRQVYRGLNLGSGKIKKEEMRGIPHHLLDVADPRKVFSVADFQKLGEQTLQDILSRGKLPVLCGGTGFYIDTLVEGLSLPNVPPNENLRRELSKKTTEELQYLLKKKFTHTRRWWESIPFLTHPKHAQNIDMRNPARIIRAIEIINALGHIPRVRRRKKYRPLFIGMSLPKEKLEERIRARLLSRMNEGMIEEVKKLLQEGISHKRLRELGLEYRFVSLYLAGEISYEEMMKELERAIIRYARRQKTWFKRNKKIHWFHPNERTIIFQKIEDFLKS